MKIRNGFVSNSSSSSFIIKVKINDKCSHCGRSDINILDMLRNNDDGDTCISLEGKAEVLEDISSWGDSERHASLIKKIVNAGDDEIIACISIDNNDESMYSVLENSKNVEILEDLN